MFYVRIGHHGVSNSRRLEIMENANILGIIEVDYNGGGWADTMLNSIVEHLRFTHSEDAVAYVLKFGGIVENEMPYLKTVTIIGM